MKCPSCNDVDLAMTTRQSVEIDYCPRCRGIWLDRGELDKIIAQSERYDDDDDDDRRRHAPPPQQHHGYAPGPAPVHGYPPQHHQQPYFKKRKPWWAEILD